MNEMIEKLKDKDYVRAFGLMTPEEQECFEKVGKQNCLVYTNGGKWEDAAKCPFSSGNTYAIKPDYQPEPEPVDLEITKCSDAKGVFWLGCWSEEHLKPFVDGVSLPHSFTHLHCLPSLPNFVCFWEETETDKDKTGYRLDKAFWIVGLAADKADEGKKVYARFRR